VQVASKNFAEIVYDIVDVPFFNPFLPGRTLEHIWVVIYAGLTDVAARDLTARFQKRYFIRKPVDLSNLRTRRSKVEIIKVWHDRGTACFWRAILFTLVAFGTSVALSTMVSHRRAAVVVHCVLWASLSATLVYPSLSTLIIGAMLVLAKRKGFVDGFLSYFPQMMDFELIDVSGPKFLAWRYMQIEKEDGVLAQIYDPRRELTIPIDVETGGDKGKEKEKG
jgi:hypothetical protein